MSLREYKREVGIPFSVEYHPQIISQAMIDKLVNAGLDTVIIGIQTGSDYIRNVIFHRPGNNREIMALVKMLAGNGIRIKYDLITNNPYDSEETLRETIDFLLRLPKPLFFNLYSLQYFPDYPLTKKAIVDKHINSEMTTPDSLLKNTATGWAYVPRRLPINRKEALQNVIWLIVWNHAKDRIVRYAVKDSSLGPKSALYYLNIKAMLLGKIFGIGNIHKHRLVAYILNAVHLLLKGDWKSLYNKIRKRLVRISIAYRSPNA